MRECGSPVPHKQWSPFPEAFVTGHVYRALGEVMWKHGAGSPRRLGISLWSQQVLFLGRGEAGHHELEDCHWCSVSVTVGSFPHVQADLG